MASRTPEGKIKAKIRKVLVDSGCYYIMNITGGFGNSGAPDFTALVAGWYIGIEAKANGGKMTALQISHQLAIEKNGGLFFLVEDEKTFAEFESFIKTLKRNQHAQD